MPAILRFIFLFLMPVFLQAQMVYKTPSGACYHLANCRMVKNVSEQLSLARANELSLRPCQICKPPSGVQSSPTSLLNKAQGENVTAQCKGITKAGFRCKHLTRIANGYCFQHQPG